MLRATPFMAAVRKICAELGVPAANYMEESFDAALTQEAPTYLEENNIFKVEF